MRIEPSTYLILGKNEFHEAYKKWGHYIQCGYGKDDDTEYYMVDGKEMSKATRSRLMEIEKEAFEFDRECKRKYEKLLGEDG